MAACIAPGCARPVHGQGLCSSHYNLALRAGVLRPRKPRAPARDRFARLVRVEGRCLVFTANDDLKFWDGQRMVHARIFAWTLAHGPPPPLGMIYVSCGDRRCVEVGHLVLRPYRGAGHATPPLRRRQLVEEELGEVEVG